jgi:hypothetical protein
MDEQIDRSLNFGLWVQSTAFQICFLEYILGGEYHIVLCFLKWQGTWGKKPRELVKIFMDGL